MLSRPPTVGGQGSPDVGLIRREPTSFVASNETVARACIDPLPLAVHVEELLLRDAILPDPSGTGRQRARYEGCKGLAVRGPRTLGSWTIDAALQGYSGLFES